MKRHLQTTRGLISVTLAIAALLGVSLGFWSCSRQDDLEKVESITVGYPPFESATLFYIAEDQGFFSRNGLKMAPRKYDTGVATLGGLLNREIDVAAGIAEFPLVGRALQKEKPIIIGNIDKAEFIYLLGRKDRGIEKVSDLRGKRVGTTFGTVAHFHLGRFLDLHGMSIKDLTLVDLKTPEEWVNAVVTGDIDAVATAQPYADFVKDRLGENGVVWPAQSGQPLHGLVISSNAWISRHPEGTKRFLESLADAEGYLISHPAEAKVILQKWLNLDAASVERIWSRNQFSLSLDQSLIVAMEDEARWMIRNKLTSEETVPNFMDYVQEDTLKAISPHAVTIIR